MTSPLTCRRLTHSNAKTPHCGKPPDPLPRLVCGHPQSPCIGSAFARLVLAPGRGRRRRDTSRSARPCRLAVRPAVARLVVGLLAPLSHPFPQECALITTRAAPSRTPPHARARSLMRRGPPHQTPEPDIMVKEPEVASEPPKALSLRRAPPPDIMVKEPEVISEPPKALSLRRRLSWCTASSRWE